MEFSNETVIPSSVFASYIEYDTDKKHYVIDEKINPATSYSSKIPLGVRVSHLLKEDRTLGVIALNAVGLEADLMRVRTDLRNQGDVINQSAETISQFIIRALGDNGWSDDRISEFITELNEELHSTFQIPNIKRTYVINVKGSVTIEDLEFQFEIEASSEDEAREEAESNIGEYIDIQDALRDSVWSVSAEDMHIDDIDVETKD
jgi:hypothetical protein